MLYSWVRDASERAVATFAQAVLTVVGGDFFNIWSIDWKTALGVGAGGAVLSVLKSLAARHVGEEGTASLAD